MELIEPALYAVVYIAYFVTTPWRWAKERRRLRRLSRLWGAWAGSRGWTMRDRWEGMGTAFSSKVFGRGGTRRALFGYEGMFDGVPVAGFSHEHTSGCGPERETTHRHVSMLRVPGARFPGLTVTPQTSKTERDVQFEDTEFNRSWHVTGAVPRFTHDVVHPRMMQWLTSALLPRSSSVCFERDTILITTPGILTPEQVDDHLRLLTRTVALVPGFVLREVGCRHPLPIADSGPGGGLAFTAAASSAP
ncbi:hypothetical protein [Tessaracoccus antarcticus]|uniref:Uncharacterized protein n=1 Tax=Tessaracoccus antarcticus TaxID=2479848 RepID=A0A3M0GAB5_9ACTN|nr:hypothetical protein [Tessaracoccus antarcticus]RMB61955.1 hypothetical protein EAX62_05035 [Tessaracoccus antarcticus]